MYKVIQWLEVAYWFCTLDLTVLIPITKVCTCFILSIAFKTVYHDMFPVSMMSVHSFASELFDLILNFNHNLENLSDAKMEVIFLIKALESLFMGEVLLLCCCYSDIDCRQLEVLVNNVFFCISQIAINRVTYCVLLSSTLKHVWCLMI